MTTPPGFVHVEAIKLLKRILGATGNDRLHWANSWTCWCPGRHEEGRMKQLLHAGLVEEAWQESCGAIYYRPTPLAGELFGLKMHTKKEAAQ